VFVAMPPVIRNLLPEEALTNATLGQHLARAATGEGRWFARPDGGRKFVCAMGESPDGCPWCDHVGWPGGNPLDAEP
jgi:hypothetical protein